MATNKKGQFVREDLTGRRNPGACFVVDSFCRKAGNGGSKWWIKCDVTGKRWEMWAETFKRGALWCQDCRPQSQSKAKTVHGHAGKKKTPAYRCWASMHTRCSNTNHRSFNDYGGRGITVCDEWRDFQTFLNDMGEPPLGKTIERIDNSKGYSKENCRWATMREQSNNRRTSKFITFNGKTQTISQWAIELGIDKTVIRQRLLKGWPIEKVLSTQRFNKKII